MGPTKEALMGRAECRWNWPFETRTSFGRSLPSSRATPLSDTGRVRRTSARITRPPSCGSTTRQLDERSRAWANRRDGLFNVMVRNAAAAHLAAWVWHSADVLGLERKRTAAQQVAAWIPPKEKAGRYGVVRKPWTAHDDEIVMSHNQAEAARILGRTASSVSLRTWRLRNAMSRRAAP